MSDSDLLIMASGMDASPEVLAELGRILPELCVHWRRVMQRRLPQESFVITIERLDRRYVVRYSIRGLEHVQHVWDLAQVSIVEDALESILTTYSVVHSRGHTEDW